MHFAVIVLTRLGLAEEAQGLLAPYYVGLETAPYETDCQCVLGNAAQAARLAARRRWSDLTVDTPWEHARRTAVWEYNYLRRHREVFRPLADCLICNGTGRIVTTANPYGYWQGYVIGGKWSGELYGTANWRDAVNIRTTLELLNHDGQGNIYCPVAVVTPQGQWVQKKGPFWFGLVTEDKSWQRRLEKLYLRYGDTVAVLVDCWREK